ncbi:condensation domain-containing protein [Streptomyces sp. AD16]|nr:condensation domain-containing protein [Streptomyces sp. AD16]
MGEHRPTYLTTLALDLSGPLHRAVWERSLDDLVARHEILRTVLPYGPDGPEQHILSLAEAPLDLRFLELAPGEERAAVEAELARGFDLLTGTPLRARLLRTGPERHLLLLVVHHVAVDGHSLGVLRGDLRHAYAARLKGEAPGGRLPRRSTPTTPSGWPGAGATNATPPAPPRATPATGRPNWRACPHG